VRKSTLGKDVLGGGSVHSKIIGKQSADVPQDPQEERQKSRERVTIYLPPELIEKAKDIVYWTPGMTMADLAELAFADLIEKMQTDRGEAFQKRPDKNLRAGRRPA
jgi:hypothetical protein